MTRVSFMLLSIGTALFVALLAWQGLGSVASLLAVAGWGLVVVAAFHALPLVIDAAAIAVLYDARAPRPGAARILVARWAGESVNSLLPAGQIGGPVLMVRYLTQRGEALPATAAAITVSTTMQAAAQIVFALLGLALFGMAATAGSLTRVGEPVLVATLVLLVVVVAFVRAQRHGVFGRGLRFVSQLLGRRDWSQLTSQADAIDRAVRTLYADRRRMTATFVLSLVGWLVGTGEVWLALRFLGHPVGWTEALLLESVGQAIRGAAFAIPGSLGVQEGGYLLLAPLVGLPPDTALALSLAKRVRELMFGLPGLVALQWSERRSQRVGAAPLPVAD